MTRSFLLMVLTATSPFAWSSARADPDLPLTTPMRDVDVTYVAGQTGPGAQAVVQRSRWSASLRKMRLDTPTPGVYLIVDYAEHTMAMVSDRDRGVLDLPAPPGGLPGQAVPSGASFSRRGGAQVAGLPCTEWETLDNQRQGALACFTDDGVLLQARRGAQMLVQATRVAYGELDAAAFAVPPSYRHESPRSSR